MKLTSLTALSPLDGRYQEQTKELRPIFSEFGLIKLRLLVEIRWLKALATEPRIDTLAEFSPEANKFLDDLIENFSEKDAEHVKEIEKDIHHDVKAIEYFLREKLAQNSELRATQNFIHLACTSDDINNLAYGLMLKNLRNQYLLPQLEAIIVKLLQFAHEYAAQPMLARTHGQPATPTTVGKEFANFAARLQRLYKNLLYLPIMGKFNGTVGNFSAQDFAYPEIDWRDFAKNFVANFGLHYNEYTTQIEPHDSIAEFCDLTFRCNIVLLDLARDIWGYISLGYFWQKVIVEEVGSSIMPHKVNPIYFENAEGNLSLANAILKHLSEKLPVSRWQRDLSDSTLLRNLSVGFGHTILAYKMLLAGMDNLACDKKRLDEELEQHWEVLTEAVQTVMRRYNIPQAYEKLKSITRGKEVSKEILHNFIRKSDLPEEIKEKLYKLTPLNYLGKAVALAKEIV